MMVALLEEMVRLPFAAGNCCRTEVGTVNPCLSPVVTQVKIPKSKTGLPGVDPGAATEENPVMTTGSVPPPAHARVRSWLRWSELGTVLVTDRGRDIGIEA